MLRSNDLSANSTKEKPKNQETKKIAASHSSMLSTLISHTSSSSSSSIKKEEKVSETPLFRTNTRAAVLVHGTEPIHFLSQSYTMLTHDLAITPYSKVSCRGATRETILVDMQSTALKEYFNEFIKQFLSANEECELTQPLLDSQERLEESNSKREVKEEKTSFIYPEPSDLKTLQFLVNFVGSQLPLHGDNLVQDMMKKEHALLKLSTKQDNIALLEWCLKNQIGSCRHHVLAVIYLLVTLIDCHVKQNGNDFSQTESKVYRFRSKMETTKADKNPGSHAVVIYEANGHQYLLDSMFIRPGPDKQRIAVDLMSLSRQEKHQLVCAYLPYNAPLFFKEIVKVYKGIRKKNQPTRSSEKRSADSSEIDGNYKKPKLGK